MGSYNADAFGIAEHWDGSRWTIRRLPVPPVPPGEEPVVLPASVSRATATACVMVGGNQAATMAGCWNGITWTVQPAPDPASPQGPAFRHRCDEDEQGPPSHLPMSEMPPAREGDTGAPG